MACYVKITLKKASLASKGFRSPLIAAIKKYKDMIRYLLDEEEGTLEAGNSCTIQVEAGEHIFVAQDGDFVNKNRGKTILKATGAFALGSLTGLNDGLNKVAESLANSNTNFDDEAVSIIEFTTTEGETVNLICELTVGGKVKINREC